MQEKLTKYFENRSIYGGKISDELDGAAIKEAVLLAVEDEEVVVVDSELESA